MATYKTKPQRIPQEVIDEMDIAMRERIKNNLISIRKANITEGFRLIKRMPEWKNAIEKLKKFPKKEDTL